MKTPNYKHYVLLKQVSVLNGCSCSPEEDRLLTELLKSYQKYGRPGPVDEAVDVKYGLSLLQITDYCTRTDSITVEVWENYVSLKKKEKQKLIRM